MVLHKHIYKETICLRESVVRASKVYERWSSSGVLSACVQICLPNTSERESTVDGSSVYRTTLVRQNQNMVARPFLPMFNKARHFNWLIT